MKYFFRFFILLFVVQAYAQDAFPYQRQWATYFEGAFFDKQGNAVFLERGWSNYSLVYNDPGFYGFLLSPALNPTNIPANGAGILARLNTDQTLAFVAEIGPVDGGADGSSIAFKSVDTDEYGNIYVFGTTLKEEEIATPGAYQEAFNNNYTDYYEGEHPWSGGTQIVEPFICFDGFIMKFSPQGEKIWGTYLNGNKQVHQLRGKTDGDYLYIRGLTSSYDGIATPGTYITEWEDDQQHPFVFSNFMIKLDTQTGYPVWGTYLNQPDISADNDTNFTRLFTINSSGNIFSLVNNKILILSSSGSFVGESDTVTGYTGGDVLRMESDDEGNVYVLGVTTSDTGIATSGTYKTTKTFDEENFIIKYDAQGQKIWGSYLGENKKLHNYNEAPMGFIAHQGGAYIGHGTDEAGLGTSGVFQENKSEGRDAFFMKLDAANGQLEWFSYYGGSGDDAIITDIGFDPQNNMYLASSKSTYGEAGYSPKEEIITQNALFNFATMSSYGFLARFTHTDNLSIASHTNIITEVYPNPASDVLYIQSSDLIAAVSVSDALGRNVFDLEGSNSNNMAINVAHLRKGLYFVSIMQPGKNTATTVKFIKK